MGGNGGNGWKNPYQRWLRIVTTVVVLGVFAYIGVTFDQTRDSDDVVVLALAIGAVLVLLGYEGAVRLPIIGHKEEHEP